MQTKGNCQNRSMSVLISSSSERRWRQSDVRVSDAALHRLLGLATHELAQRSVLGRNQFAEVLLAREQTLLFRILNHSTQCKQTNYGIFRRKLAEPTCRKISIPRSPIFGAAFSSLYLYVQWQSQLPNMSPFAVYRTRLKKTPMLANCSPGKEIVPLPGNRN